MTRWSDVSPWSRFNQAAIDAVVAVVLTVALVVVSLDSGLLVGTKYVPLDALGLLLLVAQTLPLAVRQRYPMAVFAITGTAISLYSVLGYVPSFGAIGVLIALYTVASRTDRKTALIAGGITAVGITVSFAGLAVRAGTTPTDLLLDIAANFGLYATAWILGDNIRVRRAYTSALEARAAVLEREREEQARLAVSEERARIARELHDVVAHHVSVMVVQAAAARRVLASHPDQAADALGAIETTGRQALSEMRGMLGVLRQDEASDDLVPQPGLERIDTLLESVREAGLPVDLVIEGTPRALPPGLDLSAYRIVQEALTNTLKHAGMARARVLLRYGDNALELEVTDDGRGAAAALRDGERSPGHGLIGMRERVSLFGGEMTAGPRSAGGYAVRARLPIGATGG